MKMKFIIGAVCIIAVGAGIAYLCLKNNKQNDGKIVDDYDKDNDIKSAPSDVLKADFEETVVADRTLQAEKQDVSRDIIERHSLAAEEMRKSLENITNEESVEKTQNTEGLENILDDMDKLME